MQSKEEVLAEASAIYNWRTQEWITPLDQVVIPPKEWMLEHVHKFMFEYYLRHEEELKNGKSE